DWVKSCEALLALDKKMPSILRGDLKPAGVDEQLGLAELCLAKKLYGSAVDFYSAAFVAEPKQWSNIRMRNRYNAARAAALAACGHGGDAPKLGDKERERFSKQARSWLTDILMQYGELLDKGHEKTRAFVHVQMQHCQQDPDFAGVRGDALAKLPEAE